MTPNQYTFRYRVRNWSDYNRALIARGRLTFWFDEDAVAAWRNADPPKGPGALHHKVLSSSVLSVPVKFRPIPCSGRIPPTGSVGSSFSSILVETRVPMTKHVR